MYNIKSRIFFLKDVSSPKVLGVKSGYAPHHKFKHIDYLVSGFHSYFCGRIYYPGDEAVAEITFPSWQDFGGDVSVGDEFEVRELDRVVGRGTVLSIVT